MIIKENAFTLSDEYRTVFESLLGVFIILKLTGDINWSWFCVFLPLIIPTALAIIVFLVSYSLKLYSKSKVKKNATKKVGRQTQSD